MPSTPSNTSHDEGQPFWFIFTRHGGCFGVPADGITKAVSAWRKAGHKNAGDIVGVIRGAAQVETFERTIPAHCFGVIVCVQETGGKAGEKAGATKGAK